MPVYSINAMDDVASPLCQDSCQWQHGIHQFLQAKHNLVITPESLTSASIAHPTYFGVYQEIYGLSGTVGELSERKEIEDIYHVDSIDVPPHFPSQRQIFAPYLLAERTSHWHAVLEEIRGMKKIGRPVLVLFESIKDSVDFSAFLSSRGLVHQLLNEKQKESEDYIIARAGEAGMITVATNTAGRGTDIILSLSSLEAGGLHTIFTFYPKNLRVEWQGFGRSARQGQPGSCRMILNAQDSRIMVLLRTANPALLLEYMGQQSDAEKLNFIAQLRTGQITVESNKRRYFSDLEVVYFIFLKEFFSLLQNLHHNFSLPSSRENIQQICQLEPKAPATSSTPIDEQATNWNAIYQNARVLVANQKNNKKIDWTSFITQYQETFVKHVVNLWATFYSQLTDQMHGTDPVLAKEYIDDTYKKFNLSALVTQEAAVDTLSYLLYKASQPSVGQKKIKKSTLTFNFFPPDPDTLYSQAVAQYNAKNFQAAIELCNAAIKGYKDNKGCKDKNETSYDVAICYSTLASCYRELGLLDNSIQNCEQAIILLLRLAGEKTDPMKKILVK
jgi:preprotein translocase subunit SecA